MRKLNPEKYIGQTRTMNCGMKATIIAYRGCYDMDVKFENGTVRKHVRTHNFNRGTVTPTLFGIKNDYIGQTRTMNCGMKATIIDYNGCHDISIQFENGTIREHVTMTCFRNGEIPLTPFGIKTDYIGQTRIMNCGMKATIIAYQRSDNINIQFENGTIREHVTTDSFNKGKIRLPILGKTSIMKCGLKATIIKYRNYKDIDVQFEDGTIEKHMTTTLFNRGGISHPTNILFDTYKLGKVAFQFHDKTYFYVTYIENDNEISEVMCIDDMKRKLPTLAH